MQRWLVWICWTVLFAILPTLLSATIGYLFKAGSWPTSDEIFGSGQLLLTSIGLIGYAARELAVRDGQLLFKVRYLLIFFCFGFMLFLGGIYGAIYAASLLDPATGDPFVQIPRHLIVSTSWVIAVPSLLVSGVVSLLPTAGRSTIVMEPAA